ncbi:MAG: hypothetical protein GC145_02650 [Caulobacter sp.]|nr:hypothetical protein [Caulobacter sp.]
MSRFPAALIGALSATTLLAWSGAASAETIAAGDLAAMGSGYSSADAPLGQPVELAIDLKGRIPARCEVTSPPAGLSSMSLLRPGSDASAFGIDCNAPFILRVRSASGGFAALDPGPGGALLKPYDLSVSLGTDAGRRNLGWCSSATLTDSAAAGCDFAPSAGWSSGEATAIRQTGALRVRWTGSANEAPLVGDYRDTIVIELEVRS